MSTPDEMKALIAEARVASGFEDYADSGYTNGLLARLADALEAERGHVQSLAKWVDVSEDTPSLEIACEVSAALEAALSAHPAEETDALNAGVVLAALDDMLAPWTLHRGSHLSALKHRLRRLRKHVAEHVRPAPTEWEYGRRHRETGRIAPLRGKPFPDWWGESQVEWGHVRRPAGGWSPVPTDGNPN